MKRLSTLIERQIIEKLQKGNSCREVARYFKVGLGTVAKIRKACCTIKIPKRMVAQKSY